MLVLSTLLAANASALYSALLDKILVNMEISKLRGPSKIPNKIKAKPKCNRSTENASINSMRVKKRPKSPNITKMFNAPRIMFLKTSLCFAWPISWAKTARIASLSIFSNKVSNKTTFLNFPKPLKKALSLVERFEASITWIFCTL